MMPLFAKFDPGLLSSATSVTPNALELDCAVRSAMVAPGSIPAGYRRMRSCLCFRQSRLRNKFFRMLQNVYRKSFVPGISRIFNLQPSKIALIACLLEAKGGPFYREHSCSAFTFQQSLPKVQNLMETVLPLPSRWIWCIKRPFDASA